MEWTVDTRIPNPCLDNSVVWHKDYNLCMKMTLPLAEVGRFDRISSGPTFKFQKEYDSFKLTSYISPCDGDSGSGQWVTNHL